MVQFFPTRAVAIDLFGFAIHWYGLLYLLSFAVAALLLPRLQRYRNLAFSTETWMELLSWAVLGVILGGRLGYVFFYEPQYFIASPLKIFALWEGGMAFHGGFLGVVIALLLFCWKKKINPLAIGDIVVTPTAIGLALGRLGNFINQELYGTVTTLPWGMRFPGAEGLRHPIQFYEMGTDLLAALLCFLYLRTTASSGKSPGRVFALFMLLYGIARFCIEYVRDQQNYGLTILGPIALTRGQLLTLPILLAGILLWAFSGRTPHVVSNVSESV